MDAPAPRVFTLLGIAQRAIYRGGNRPLCDDQERSTLGAWLHMVYGVGAISFFA